MIPINRTYAPLQAFVEELYRCGMRHAVTSPGSRNAPLALTLAAQEGIESVSVIDERSAGFVALGMAKTSGRPVAVTCTSGTAAANLHPAVVEAHEARVPLIVLTADRPPELREVGAGQAIDQIKLYGTAAKWFVEVGTHEPGRETAIHHRALACRAYWTAAGGRPGPVHLNFPLRDPLAPASASEGLDPADWTGRPDGRPWTEVRAHASSPHSDDVHAVAKRIAAEPRGLIVCGPCHENVAEAASQLAAETGWPLLAEPTSGVRCGDHDCSHVIAHYDVLLRIEDFAGANVPELVLRVGDMPTSKPLREFVATSSQIVVDPHRAWHEPTRRAELVLHASAERTLAALAGAVEMRREGRSRAETASVDTRAGDGGWLQRWREADASVPAAVQAAPEGFEGRILAGLEPELPDEAVVWVSSSMPIRDVEAYFPQSPKRLRFLANRGANGIDGVVSSAMGAAIASGLPTWVLIGELALQHDAGGLLAARRAGVPLEIVCINNGGGGIFDFLPVAEHADPAAYEAHIATPSEGVDLAALWPGLREVRTDRRQNVRFHRELVERVAQSLS
jgi:2-succinyl-5-enolpyruvyl-6-hydroxy-3-cyclohexene-1-carboxylate synthase